MLRKLAYLFLLFLGIQLYSSEQFERGMGKGKPVWKYLQTPEDRTRFAFFETLFDAYQENPSLHIPKVLHFIWLGPEPFPQTAVKNLAKWMQLHPDWKYKFWTDLNHPIPLPEMEREIFHPAYLKTLRAQFFDSINHGEKAKILAYEVLFQEGGVYVDHDVIPSDNFERLNFLDFFCGLEPLAPSILSSCVIPSTHLIGARPGHPILQKTMDWLKYHWDFLSSSYPGVSSSEQKNRICHRTLWAFSEGIEYAANQDGNKDVVFPASYFSMAEKKYAQYAVHLHENTWCNQSSNFEKKMNHQFKEMLHEDDQLVIVALFLLGVTLLGCTFLFMHSRSIKRGPA